MTWKQLDTINCLIMLIIKQEICSAADESFQLLSCHNPSDGVFMQPFWNGGCCFSESHMRVCQYLSMNAFEYPRNKLAGRYTKSNMFGPFPIWHFLVILYSCVSRVFISKQYLETLAKVVNLLRFQENIYNFLNK
ncbi:hypothetical protein EDC96DRAFT_543157 [Choanephora cucurbitarum]|nr:hypothetical protein EDC96DRAFT_543157 [Choanephora cucurbitarum]